MILQASRAGVRLARYRQPVRGVGLTRCTVRREDVPKLREWIWDRNRAVSDRLFAKANRVGILVVRSRATGRGCKKDCVNGHRIEQTQTLTRESR
jgi:hypothetical protein